MTSIGIRDAALDDRAASELWGESGARWLTDRGVRTPGGLVRRVVGLADALDERGAGLSQLVGANGLGLLAERAATMGLPPSSTRSAGGATGFVECADGWLALTLARDEDLELLPAWIGGEIAAGVDLSDPWASLPALSAGLDAGVLVESATLLGLPCARIGEVTDGRPVLVEPLGEATARTLDGAVVVNLAALWAGPLCADLLARLGGRVITVESTRRPDGGRRAPRFFEALHGRTESVALDLTSPDGTATLQSLLERADVVIEGSRPRALLQMGIDARELVRRGPQVWVSITSHGRGAHDGLRVGFGDDSAAAGGLVGWVDGSPRFVADAVADPVTGLTAALAVAELAEQGGRWLVDVALARVARSCVGGWIADAGGATSARPRTRSDRGRRLPLGRDTRTVLASLAIDEIDRRG